MSIPHQRLRTFAPALILVPLLCSAYPTGGLQAKPPVASTPTVSGVWDGLKLDPSVRIKLGFRNAHIDNVIAILETASQVTIAKDPSLKGTITVTTAKPVPLTEAFHVFNTVLKMEGYEMTRDGQDIVITKSRPQPAPPPPAQPTAGTPAPQKFSNVVDWYPLTYANASQVARAVNEAFQPFTLSPGQPGYVPDRQRRDQRAMTSPTPPVRASYEEFSNSVIVNAPPEEQTEIGTLIKEIDTPQSQDQVTKSYSLKFASATEILPSVLSMLSANVVKGRGWKGNNSLAQQFFGFTVQQNQNLAVADARTNSILVTGSPELIKVADKVIKSLDHEIASAGTTFVFKLKNARADAVANLLTAAFGQRQGVQNSGRLTTITPTNNSFNNSAASSRPISRATKPKRTTPPPATTTTTATPAITKDSKSLQVPLEDPNSSSGVLQTSVEVTQTQAKPIVGHDETGHVVSVHELAGQVTAIADPNTNSIIVVTEPDNLAIVKSIIEQLDVRPDQVMIETAVVEASLDKATQFGLEWNYAQGKSGSGGQTFGLQSASPPLQGLSYTLSSGGLSGFLNTLQTDTKFQVLATPRIFTTNNMESQINISQSIPYVTSTIENVNGTFSFNYAFQDVGIVLTVTPHITDNGYVTMDVLQTADDLQGYTTFNAPIVNQREAETTISAKDGDTIILGGMIRNQVTSTVNKIPLLGDLPLLGKLFRSSNSDHQKTELLVFLTPHIVRDPAEAKRLKDETEKEISISKPIDKPVRRKGG
ncbi:MAG: secretin N-terminal domain-containing protein [Fimbriimonas sp.]|nr:secretin N-terminal domain-containing protein [Fimbriimonas sp.]